MSQQTTFAYITSKHLKSGEIVPLMHSNLSFLLNAEQCSISHFPNSSFLNKSESYSICTRMMDKVTFSLVNTGLVLMLLLECGKCGTSRYPIAPGTMPTASKNQRTKTCYQKGTRKDIRGQFKKCYNLVRQNYSKKIYLGQSRWNRKALVSTLSAIRN